MIVLGLIDFGRILFTYAQASNSLRDALRYAELMGANDGKTTPPYLDCTKITSLASNNFFAEKSPTVTITYVKSDNPSKTYSCKTVTDSALSNGDMLQVSLAAKVKPLFLPFGTLNITFSGQRSIVKILPISVLGGFDTSNIDTDGDGTPDHSDNCVYTYNPDQLETDLDGIGDVCDNCPYVYNPTQDDGDSDGIGNACEGVDSDGDGVADAVGNCPGNWNPDQADSDFDGIGDSCDHDTCTEIAAPTGFKAEPNCTTGKVTFSWNPVSLAAKRIDIFNADTGLIVVSIPNTITPSTIQDTISTWDGYRNYYAVAYGGTPEVASSASNSDDAACLVEPPPPTSLTGFANCLLDGKVTIGWGYSTYTPSRVQLTSTDGTVSISMPGSQTLCSECDVIPTSGGSRTYIVTAYNGVPGHEVSSLPSDPLTLTCGASPGTGKVSGTLVVAQNKNKPCDAASALPGAIIQLRNATTGALAKPETVTASNGYYEFTGVTPGTYRLDLPGAVGTRTIVSYTQFPPSATCVPSTSKTSFTFTVTDGSTTWIDAAYY